MKSLTYIVLFFVLNCAPAKNTLTEKVLFEHGRTETTGNSAVKLIGSASSVSFVFKGTQTVVALQSLDSYDHHNYINLEVDGTYKGRFRVEKGAPQEFKISAADNGMHHVEIFKATEAANGSILVNTSATNGIIPSTEKPGKRIEFIGNSITSGMGNDLTVPCGTGEWFDQHNAYFSYASILSRALNADFLLSSVSGIGMYRNWNDEHLEEPVMPDVYNNLYLNKDSSKPFPSSFQPDLVSICLGTNDLSDGDGKKPRLPFNEAQYVQNYVEFIKNIYARYPNTRIVLLTSPMISGDRNITFVNALKKVIHHFDTDKQHEKITLFQFQPMSPRGCGYHPDIEDHKILAAELESTFKNLLDE